MCFEHREQKRRELYRLPININKYIKCAEFLLFMSQNLTWLLIDPREKAYESETESFKGRLEGWIHKYIAERGVSGSLRTYKTWFHIDDDHSFKPEEVDVLINSLLDYMDKDHDEYLVDIDNIMYASEVQEKKPELLCIFTLNQREFRRPLDYEIAHLRSEMARQLPKLKAVYFDEGVFNYNAFAKLMDELACKGKLH